MNFSGIALVVFGSYLLGSIPFGLLAGKMKGIDIRQHGSGNIGATNAFRVLGKKWGIAVFICDALKGLVAVRAAMFWGHDFSSPAAAGITGAIFCILGHNFPVWLKFKGGKGVATSLGVVIGLVPMAAAIAFALWGAILFASGYVSVASICAAISVPVTVALTDFGPDRKPLLIFMSLAALLIVARHRANIKRLLNGTESRFKKPKPDAK